VQIKPPAGMFPCERLLAGCLHRYPEATLVIRASLTCKDAGMNAYLVPRSCQLPDRAFTVLPFR
jgi:hypothetical protein